MKEIRIKTTREYSVLVGHGAVAELPQRLPALTSAHRLLIVTDDNVAPLHLPALEQLLTGYELHHLVLPHGEEHKNLDTIVDILTCLKSCGFDRNDLVIALGGGVVGDMAAFAASIYMRGISFINIPTTLLAQVDSSVGGKTGVDFGGAKNIVGSFHQPLLVICDTAYLSTLPPAVFADGCAEVIKYAFIDDAELLELIDRGISANIEAVVSRCVENKGRIVAGDEADRGQRALLNLGHTVGHAVEALSDYQISHGSAVAIGLHVITAAAEQAGLCEVGVQQRLAATLSANNLPLACPYGAEALLERIRSDKKVSGDGISVILPQKMCSSRIEKMSFDQLLTLLKGVLE